MLGGFAVGKTSLVSRFVRSLFSDKYHTTVGVKVDKKSVSLPEGDVELVLWDIYGDDDFQKLRTSYLRGASGYLLVVDGTRASTLDTAEGIRAMAFEALGDVPFVLVANKADLADTWEVSDLQLQALAAQGWTVVRTSAKDGEGVNEAFSRLARAMVAR